MTDRYKPAEIEAESFRIIEEEIRQMGRQVPEEYAAVIKRVIHTTADFSYLDSLYFSEQVMTLAKEALRSGSKVITDTNMAKAGINRRALHKLGGEVVCYMADEEVAREAAQRQVTRAQISMERTVLSTENLIYVIGNAPTALLTIVRLTREGRIRPRFVIGAPVGFVNVTEAKRQLMASGIPCIVPEGRKGGSNVAAAILNALLYEVAGREEDRSGTT